MSSAQRLSRFPDAIAAVAALPDPSYSDVFTAHLPAGTPPLDAEEWSRLLFEGRAAPLRWFLLFGWRVALGLKLGPTGSTEHVLGWKVAYKDPDRIRLEQQSGILRAALVTHIHAEQLTQVTFVRYQSFIGRLIWPPVALLHRRIVPHLLAQATTEVSSRAPRAV